MAFLRQRTRGNYALAWKWKGSSYIKGLGTKDLAEAKRIKQDAVDQLARIRSGESALASKLLADSHSILDVLFGADEIGHLIASPADDNPLTLSQLKEAFIDNLGVTRRIDFLSSWSRGRILNSWTGITPCGIRLFRFLWLKGRRGIRSPHLLGI